MQDQENQMEIWKNEVMRTEFDFAEMARTEGIAKAFEAFAANDAVLSRNNALVIGKEGIRNFYEKRDLTNVSLEWKPDFIQIAASGDLAYTYGKYTYAAIDSAGISTSSNGIFHTVWKRQVDGSWKYVWD
jgi:ketosteroid isomerase-like protein